MARESNEEDPKKAIGEPTKFDPTFKGPIKNRSCTDVICLILFLICFLAMIVVAAWAYHHGDPSRLLYPTDSDGNLCGVGNYQDRPYLVFFDMTECAKLGASVINGGCPTPQICVSQCPRDTWTYVLELEQQIRPISRSSINLTSLICKFSVDLQTTDLSLSDLVKRADCAAYYLASKPLVGRCIPEIIANIATEILKVNNTSITDKVGNAVNGTLLGDTKWLQAFLNVQSYGEKILGDVRASWWLILVFLGIGAVISFVWIILMRCIACPIVWITLFAFLGLFTFSTYYCFTRYVALKGASNETIEFSDIKITTDLDYWSNLYYTWLSLGIISAVILGIVLIILLFLRERICIAIRLIEEASRAVGSMMFTLIWPIFPFIFQIAVFAFWGASAIYLASIGKRTYGASNVTLANGTTQVEALLDDICDASNITHQDVDVTNSSFNGTAGKICSFIKYGGNDYTLYLQAYQLFMLFWCMNFVVAVGQMTLAGAFASYYWAFEKPRDIPTFPLAAALWRVFRYHLGSVAFGSLIIAIIQMIRVILEYVDHKLKGKDNKLVKFIMCCLKCCFWCLEKFMKFLNKNAYILIAIYGKNFCVSAKNAFFLIMRNVVRVVVIDKVTDFLLFVGKLVVVGAVTMIAFYFFSGDMKAFFDNQTFTAYSDNYVPNLNYSLAPVIIILLGVYVIAAGFFSVYNMAVDTLFLCFLEDLERHDGSAEKPYYMSKGLMKILGKKNVKGDEDEKSPGCCSCCC